jgi:NADP-reducing hydrogenase subunit HndB
MAALVEELHTRNIMDVSVTMTGCLGLCRLEPIVEVIDTDGNKVTYVKMDANKAKRVIAEHVINGQVCQDLTITSEDTK